MGRIKKILSQRVEWVLVITFFVIMTVATMGFYFWGSGKLFGMFLITLPGVIVSFGVFVYIAGTYVRDNRTRTAQLYYQTVEQVDKVEEALTELHNIQHYHIKVCKKNPSWDANLSDWDAYVKFVKSAQDKIDALKASEQSFLYTEEYKTTELVWNDTHPAMAQLENLGLQLQAEVLDESIVFRRIGSMLKVAYRRLEPGFIVRKTEFPREREDEIEDAETYREATRAIHEILKDKLRKNAKKYATYRTSS